MRVREAFFPLNLVMPGFSGIPKLIEAASIEVGGFFYVFANDDRRLAADAASRW
jgi:hypothetical protein